MQIPRKPSSTASQPLDYASILASDEPLFLVGGQAVNLWALYYHERTAALSPFVSHDLDVLGDRNTLRRIARTANVEPQFFPSRPPTNEIGSIIAQSIDGNPLSVEVLDRVHGISTEELRNPEYTIGIGDSGVIVRVPGPIALLKAKIANYADIPQAGRQDGRHIRILAILMPSYLTDLEASVSDRRIGEREMLTLLERLLAIVTSKKGRCVFKELVICGKSMFSEIQPLSSSKLQTFMSKRLARALP